MFCLSIFRCLVFEEKNWLHKKGCFQKQYAFFPQDNLSFMSPQKKHQMVAFSIWMIFSSPTLESSQAFFFKNLWVFSKDSDSIGKTGILETCHVQALVPSVTRSLAKLNEQNHVGKNGCSAWGIMTKIGGGNSNTFIFVIPIYSGRWTHFDTYISDGLVRQPPTRWWVSWVSVDSLKPKTVDKNWDCNVGLRGAPKNCSFSSQSRGWSKDFFPVPQIANLAFIWHPQVPPTFFRPLVATLRNVVYYGFCTTLSYSLARDTWITH